MEDTEMFQDQSFIQFEEFFPSDIIRTLQWGSSSMYSPEYSSMFQDNSIDSLVGLSTAATGVQPTCSQAKAIQHSNQDQSARFSHAENDEDVVMKALMTVISSSASSYSSSSSPPSVISQQLQDVKNQAQSHASFQAFKPYNSAVVAPPNFLPPCGQKMIKKSIAMFREINSRKPEPQEEELLRSTSSQLHHTVAERRRREKLNDSFQRLRMLLPPSSKKDKASLLNNTKNYMNTLKTQISQLTQKNQRLETHLSIFNKESQASEDDQAKEINNPNGSTKVQIIRVSEPTAEVQQINLKITASVECEIIELVLHILQCLEELKITDVAEVDAYICSPQRHLFARVNVKMQIKASDWDETSFHEAMAKAIYRVTAASS